MIGLAAIGEVHIDDYRVPYGGSTNVPTAIGKACRVRHAVAVSGHCPIMPRCVHGYACHPSPVDEELPVNSYRRVLRGGRIADPGGDLHARYRSGGWSWSGRKCGSR